MAAGEEKEVTMTPSATEGTRKRGRPRRNKTQRSGEAVVTKEETVITKKGNEPAKAIKVESQQVFKLVPKIAPAPVVTAAKKSASIAPAVAPVVPTKVTILPKKRVQKITILSKTPKKPFVPTVPVKTEAKTEAKAEPKTEVKQKITLPASKKTRKQYKERKLRIEL